MDCTLPGSSVHEICQARVLKWVAIGISNFLDELSSLSHSIVFLYFFALITEEGFCISFLLFFETLNSNGYIASFLLCLSTFTK